MGLKLGWVITVKAVNLRIGKYAELVTEWVKWYYITLSRISSDVLQNEVIAYVWITYKCSPIVRISEPRLGCKTRYIRNEVTENVLPWRKFQIWIHFESFRNQYQNQLESIWTNPNQIFSPNESESIRTRSWFRPYFQSKLIRMRNDSNWLGMNSYPKLSPGAAKGIFLAIKISQVICGSNCF